MGYYAIDDVIEVKVYCFKSPQLSVNVRHYKATAEAGTGATPANVAFAVDNHIATTLKLLLSAQANYKGVSVQRIAPLPKDVPTYDATGAGAGGVAGDALPTQTCGIFTLRTANAGRAYRGRMYVPFPGEGSSTVDGLPTAIYLGDLTTYADKWLDSITAGGGGNTTTFSPVLVNKNFPGVIPALVSQITRAKWATQRRRGSYGQGNVSPV